MADHLKAFQFVVFLIGVKPRLLQGDRDLLLDSIDAVQVGQKQSSSAPLCDDHAVALYIQLIRGRDFLGFSQYVNSDLERIQFGRPDGGKAGIPHRSAQSILRDFLRDTAAGRRDRSDASAQPSILMDGDKSTGPAMAEFFL